MPLPVNRKLIDDIALAELHSNLKSSEFTILIQLKFKLIKISPEKYEQDYSDC